MSQQFREPTTELPKWLFLDRSPSGKKWLRIISDIDDETNEPLMCMWIDEEMAEELLEVLLDICPNAKALAHNWLLEAQKREHMAGKT